jgi:hypothetical protein
MTTQNRDGFYVQDDHLELNILFVFSHFVKTEYQCSLQIQPLSVMKVKVWSTQLIGFCYHSVNVSKNDSTEED